jgi:hypothetical protein
MILRLVWCQDTILTPIYVKRARKIKSQSNWGSLDFFHFTFHLRMRSRLARNSFSSSYFFLFADADSLSMPPSEQQTQQLLQHYRQPPMLPTLPTKSARTSESLCNSQEQEKFIPDEGFDSSVIMDLKPGRTVNSCKRYFTAPDLSGLFIRLVKVDADMNSTRRNLSEFCPLSIVSTRNISFVSRESPRSLEKKLQALELPTCRQPLICSARSHIIALCKLVCDKKARMLIGGRLVWQQTI